MNHQHLTRFLIAAGAISMFSVLSAHAAQIDTFADNSPQIVSSAPSGLFTSADVKPTASAVGGTRIMNVVGGPTELSVLGIAGNGTLQFANSPNAVGLLDIIYDPSALDLTDGGASTGFLFTVEFTDKPIDYTIFVSDPVNASTVGGTIPAGIVPSSTIDVYVPFVSLTGIADVTNVEDIQLTFTASNGIAGADLEISNFRTGVPEPSSLALLALGGLAMMRRRG